MKLNIPERLARSDWWPLKRAVFLSLTVILSVGLVAVIASDGSKKSSAQKEQPERILYIGDSLSVGKFGEFVGDYLVRKHSQENVALYASCGSSPENWLRWGVFFRTRCGYRERTVRRSIMGDPMSHETPTVETLIPDMRPTTVIVQLGTNWMDRLAANPAKEAEIQYYLETFVNALDTPPVRRIVWITPPDASHYSSKVQDKVLRVIENAAHGNRKLQVINCRHMMTYKLGVTGGDGVHYRAKPAEEWADQVKRELAKKNI